jgi:hypothetical protein
MHNINSGVMVNMPDDPAQIVRFWHAVEMFSPQQLPRIAARNHVADFRPGDPMPWEPGGKLPQAKSGKIWRHVVFGGVYDLSKIRDVLVKKYGQDDPEAATRGQSALFACTVDADGYLVQESAVLSACAWAVGQIVRGKPTLTGFREDALDYAEGLQRLTGVTKILADGIRNAVPDAVSGGVTAAVTIVLAAVRLPRPAVPWQAVWPAIWRNRPSGRRATSKRRRRPTESRDPEPAWIKPRSPVPISIASPPNSPGDSA